MRSIKLAILYGILVWALVFAAAMVMFAWRLNDRPLFESAISVVLAGVTAIFAAKYFLKVERDFIKEGILVGVLWLIINILIDLVLFSQGPMKMEPSEYLKDIGLTYLMMPAVTISIGWLLKFRK